MGMAVDKSRHHYPAGGIDLFSAARGVQIFDAARRPRLLNDAILD
jgi:hypothetical protein